MTIADVKRKLRAQSDPSKVDKLQSFFKTQKGGYGEGDKFLGVTVPNQRKIAKEFKSLPLNEVEKLLQSEYHEERLTGFLILVYKFEKAEPSEQKDIYKLILRNLRGLNNWDLIDTVAPKTIGAYMTQNPSEKDRLIKWAKSDNLWERRIAMLSCFAFIKQNEFDKALEIAEILLRDKHDLMHKAVGWMLREMGNRDLKTEEDFLKKHYKKMPRTMLRYAIEKFPEEKRRKYLEGEI